MSTNQELGLLDQDESSSSNDYGLGSSRSRGANYSVKRARPGLPSTSAKRLAKGLGWFSIGLGLAELLAPRAIANISGVSNKHTGLIRLYGLREIGAGITIFAQKKPTEGMWSRVAGDALDLTSLGIAATNPEAKLGRVAFATANVLAVTVLDVMCAMQLSNGGEARRLRHAMNPVIQPSRMTRDYCGVVVDEARAAVGRWTAGTRPAPLRLCAVTAKQSEASKTAAATKQSGRAPAPPLRSRR